VIPLPADDSLARQAWYPPGTRPVFVAPTESERGLATSLLSQVIQELWLRQDRPLQEWLKSPPPITTDISDAFANAYIDLATSSSPVAQHCLEDAGSCLEALGLARPPDPAASWFSPAARRRKVLELKQHFQVGELRRPYDRCVGGSDQHCLALLHQVPDLVASGLLPPTRVTFLGVVLETGGPGSYPVLLASDDTPLLVRFESASGGRIEAAVREWHRRVLAARPAPTTIHRGQSLAAIGWTVLLLVLGLRSSRWR
jgi:hypothetical protein